MAGAAGAVLSVLALVLSITASDAAGLTTHPLSPAVTPTDLANELAGSGVTVSNVTYAGASAAAGRFAGGGGIVGFGGGIVLSSGNIANVAGPNGDPGITGINNTAGDAGLTALSGNATWDAAVLEFDFVPQGSELAFRYVFASDEYNEYVYSQYNDVFAFTINGQNCATVSGGGGPVAVSINSINNGDGVIPASHPELYVDNDLQDGTAPVDTEMDGLTTVLTCSATVSAGATNHLKLAIADASDPVIDSVVFLESASLTVEPPTATPTATPTDTPVPTDTPTATSTDTPVPTSTHTATPTDTPVPTDTPTATPTDTPVPTSTHTPAATFTPWPTSTSTATPTPPPANTPTPAAINVCARADFSGDGYVTAKDVMMLAHHLGKKHGDGRYDLNGDGSVTVADLHIVAHCWKMERKEQKEQKPPKP